MPALRLFGRKWLAASDDLVFPCVFEICFRLVWLGLIAAVTQSYWVHSEYCTGGGTAVRVYMCGTLALIAVNLVLLVALVNRSAQGSIAETQARRHVAPLLVCKFLLIPPELALNIFATIWAFSDLVSCSTTTEHQLSKPVIEAIVVFNWVIFALILFGLAIVFDPLGSQRYRKCRDSNDNTGPTESTLHRKVSNLWMRRFRWLFCCLRSDEFGQEAFGQVASLLSALFRGTDLVPSDIMAGCILLRVRQKRETREMRRIRMLNDDGPRYSSDASRVFATSPTWMSLKNAKHFMAFAMASYGWPLVCYLHCCTGPFRLAKLSTCCSCFRSKSRVVVDDNCCLCHVAGVKFMSHLNDDDVLHASFKNQVFELPFCILADHRTKSIVIAIRGSLSMRDVFTDLTAGAERFEAPGMPPDTTAHRGMIAGTELLLKRLNDGHLLERAFATHPDYALVLTGHSLGAGVSILLGALLRPRWADLRVYAFATPAGLLSREAAQFSESYAFTIGVGDDFVMRLGVDSVENLRTSVIETIRACKFPKWRIMLNGVGYAFFGVPSRDLEKTWRDVGDIEATGVGKTAAAGDPEKKVAERSEIGAPTAVEANGQIQTIENNMESRLLSREIAVRRFARNRLYTGGKILHIVRRKKTELEKKSTNASRAYEMRWATPEDFAELQVMPRMLLDHLPENIMGTLTAVLDQQKVGNESITSLTGDL